MTSYTTSQNIDTNINNYTIGQMMTILNLQDLNEEEIKLKTNYYINRYNNSARLNPENAQLATFFYNIQIALLSSISHNNDDDDDNYEKDDGDDIYLQEDEENDYNPTKKFGLSIPQPNHIQEGFTTLESQDRQTNTLWRNEYTSQKDINQNDKITDRKHKIEIYNNEQMPMNQQQLGINNSYVVPVQQDSLNPNLKNIITRTIVIDSFYRQNGQINTDYTLDLSENLKNVLSMRLYSFSIPYTWYNIDANNNTTCFWIVSTIDPITITISIPSGNYTNVTLLSALNTAFINASISNATALLDITTGLLTMNIYGAIYIDENNIQHIINETYSLVFFQYYSTDLSCNTICNQSLHINQTLGWLLGYRSAIEIIIKTGNTTTAILNLIGPKYFILSIDDFNKNHIDDGLVGITNLNQNIKLPSYYNNDFPKQCVKSSTIDYGNTEEDGGLELSGLNLLEKYNVPSVNTFKIQPTFPRVLTNSQIYSINEILLNNAKLSTNYQSKSPDISDTIAIIPIKLGSTPFTGLYSDYPGSIQDNRREYFGNTNISKLRIKLYDDRGYLVNLNNVDWTITLLFNILYQY
jgi:hypothetical protein